jgi:hypothetical protein
VFSSALSIHDFGIVIALLSPILKIFRTNGILLTFQFYTEKILMFSNSHYVLSSEYMPSEYIYNLSPLEKKVIIILAEQGPKCGYDFHLRGKKERRQRKAIMSSSHWENIKPHLGPSGLNLISSVNLRRFSSEDERGKRKDLLWLTQKGLLLAMNYGVNNNLLLQNLERVYPQDQNLHFIIEFKHVIGQKAYNLAINELFALPDFSTDSLLKRLPTMLMVNGLLKARGLSPNGDPVKLKKQSEAVMRKYPEIYEIYEQFKRKTRSDIDALFLK